MPLLRKQPYELRKNPADLGDPRRTVLTYEPTGEIFATYDEYLAAFAQYQSPQWTCKLTGRTNLTYREAVQSEQDAAESVEAMPWTLRRFVALRANFSTQAVSTIVDGIVEDLKARYLPRELVTFEGDHGRKLTARIVGNEADVMYRLELLGPSESVVGEARVAHLNPTLINRPKNALSKILLKKFLRAILYRRTALLPWQVKADVAEQLELAMEPPPEAAALLLKDANSRMKSPSKKGPHHLHSRKLVSLESPPAGPKYPIDDDLLPIEDRIDEDLFPSLDNLEALPAYYSLALSVWTFWTTFSQQIRCTSLAWADFLESLQWAAERKNPPLEELFTALLLPISKLRKASSRPVYYEWMTSILFLFPNSSSSEREQSDTAEGEEDKALLDVEQVGDFLNAKLKWSDDNWPTLLAGFVCDCALLNPQSPYMADLVCRIMDKHKDLFGLFLLDLDISAKLSLLNILVKVHLLKFDAVKSFVDECLQGQEEAVASHRTLAGALADLQAEIAARQQLVEDLRTRQEHHKTVKKAEAPLRVLRQSEGRLLKKVERAQEQMLRVRRVRVDPLGRDHQGRAYFLFSEHGFSDLNHIYVTVHDRAEEEEDNEEHGGRWFRIARHSVFERIVQEYLNDKGTRERVLKERLVAVQEQVDFEAESMQLDAPEQDAGEDEVESTQHLEEEDETPTRKKRQGRLSKLSASAKRARNVPLFMRYKNEL
jgi:hypothetical protein